MSTQLYEFMVFAIVAVCVGTPAYIIYKKVQKRRFLGYLDSMWGVKTDREYTKDEFRRIRENAQFLNEGKPFPVDDVTWNDLEMDAVYARVNHSFTNAGDHALYEMLRSPGRRRHLENAAMIGWAGEGPEARAAIRKTLYQCGRLEHVDFQFLSGEPPFGRLSRFVAILLCAGLLAGIALAAFGFLWAVFPLVALIMGNIIYATAMHQKFTRYINSVAYLTRVSNCFRKIARGGAEIPLAGDTADMRKAADAVGKSSALSIFYAEDAVIIALNRIFLLEAISFIGVMRKINEHFAGLMEVYRFVGRVDAALAVASWRASAEGTCKPVFSASAKAFVKAEGAIHPLLEDPVPNSVSIRKNMLVTGSNATGKSTFLKTVAINALLAQTIDTCTAQTWESTYLRVFTSMALRDNLFERESYFVTEIKAIKRMLDHMQTGEPALYVVDEVLRGTNTGERIAAASEVLRRFASEHTVAVVATHDLELSFILENVYDNYHFTEHVEGGAMTFDYLLKPGPSTSTNAIKLLAMLGYDEELVKDASRRFRTFLEKGYWEKADAP